MNLHAKPKKMKEDDIMPCLEVIGTKTLPELNALSDAISRTVSGLDPKVAKSRKIISKFSKWAASCNVASDAWIIVEKCAVDLIQDDTFVKHAGISQMERLLSLDALGLQEHRVAYGAMDWCRLHRPSVEEGKAVLSKVRWDRIYTPLVGKVMDDADSLGISLTSCYPLALETMHNTSRKVNDVKCEYKISRARHDQDGFVVPAWRIHNGINVQNLKICTGFGFVCTDNPRNFSVQIGTGGAIIAFFGPRAETFSIDPTTPNLYSLAGREVDVMIVDGDCNGIALCVEAGVIVIKTAWRGQYPIACFGCEPHFS